MLVGRPQLNSEQEALGHLPEHVASSPVCRDPSDSARFQRPPFAGTLEASSAARDPSMADAALSSSRGTRCSLRQTPASFQSRSGRQHVMPLPQPISLGSISHGMPRAENEEDTGQGRSVRNRRSPTLGSGPSLGKQRLDPRPQPVS
jgi:hypothetical protein